ncbi:putative transposase [Escherichia coli W26]|nr:putative transposase [Escherichia coli W26]
MKFRTAQINALHCALLESGETIHKGRAAMEQATGQTCCRRLEDAGWLRTLRAPDLRLTVELTEA